MIKKKPHVSIYEYAFGLADLGTSSLMAAQSKRFSRDNFGTKAYGRYTLHVHELRADICIPKAHPSASEVTAGNTAATSRSHPALTSGLLLVFSANFASGSCSDTPNPMA